MYSKSNFIIVLVILFDIVSSASLGSEKLKDAINHEDLNSNEKEMEYDKEVLIRKEDKVDATTEAKFKTYLNKDNKPTPATVDSEEFTEGTDADLFELTSEPVNPDLYNVIQDKEISNVNKPKSTTDEPIVIELTTEAKNLKLVEPDTNLTKVQNTTKTDKETQTTSTVKPISKKLLDEITSTDATDMIDNHIDFTSQPTYDDSLEGIYTEKPEDTEFDDVTTTEANTDIFIDNHIDITTPAVDDSAEDNYSEITDIELKNNVEDDDDDDDDNEHHECQSILPPERISGCCGVIAAPDPSEFEEMEARSLGAEDTSLEQYPWLAVMEYPEKGSLCTAFLISSQYVMTAAHCVDKSSDMTPSSVRLGAVNRKKKGPDCEETDDSTVCNDGGISVPVDTIIVHPHYNDTNLRNDIALVKLKTMMNFTDYIRPICLPTSDVTRKAPKNLNFEFGGWGASGQFYSPKTEEYKDIFIGRRLRVDLPYNTNKVCRKVYDGIDEGWTITRKHICAGGEAGVSPCRGDSGGPLMHNNNGAFDALGVYSFGHVAPCGEPGVPGVYTKVFEYRRWILREIRRQTLIDMINSARV